MSFTQSITYCLTNYAQFSGRGGRPEYWWFYLFILLADALASVVDALTDYPVLGLVAGLGLFCPAIAAGARRLHDSGRSGWWQLVAFIPLIGWVWIIVLLVRQGTPGANPYGAATA